MNICFYFQVHQPYRLNEYSIFDIGNSFNYFNDDINRDVFLKVAKNCYEPANQLILELLSKHKNFKCAFSLSGTFLEQCINYKPTLLNSFTNMVLTGNVELLGETFYHSLASIFSKAEFFEQIDKHKNIIKSVFNYDPKSFRNTELIYSDDIAQLVVDLGYKTILAEGIVNKEYCDCPNYFYNVSNKNNATVLLRNAAISDLITFNFLGNIQEGLDPKKLAKQIVSLPGEVVNIFIDYEFIGEHHKQETGIFCFFEELVDKLEKLGANFILPYEAPTNLDQDYNCQAYTSWADKAKDLSAWLSNNMQSALAKEIYSLEAKIKKSGDPKVLDIWRKMQTSDHYYYMFTSVGDDYNAHKYFSPFEYPHEMFISFQNILRDFKERFI